MRKHPPGLHGRSLVGRGRIGRRLGTVRDNRALCHALHCAASHLQKGLIMAFDTEAFLRAYIECALWSSCGPEDGPYACENLDQWFDSGDIAPECLASMREDCEDFIASNAADLAEYCKRIGNEQWSGEARAGHDFWLTRNGHGAGFWDRGLGELGERLSQAANVYLGVDLYPGDDGKVYGV